MLSTVKKATAGLAVAGALVALTGCEEGGDSEARDASHDQMQQSQPAKVMEYSPTRETINYWVDTWDEPGKLSYVYLQSSTGDLLGYYVLEGLPVSYCAQISPPDRVIGARSAVVRQAPANDGAYYGSGNCNTFYGKDATTGAYIEYTAGLGINVLLFSEPMDTQSDVRPLGNTSVEDVQ